MIRLWLSRKQSVPMREQLSTQLLLGIVSKRLAPGERLPSVRELARRLKIHANTVSSAYKDLAARGWVKQRKGSGVYVRDVGLGEHPHGIEGFVQAWLEAGAAQGFTVQEMESTFQRMAHGAPTKQFLVADPDADLARIVAAEIAEVLGHVVPSAGFAETASLLKAETCLVVLPAQAARAVKQFRPASHITITLRSMDELLVGQRRPENAALIGLVTRSASIRKWSSTLLSALGFPAEAVLLRSPDKAKWKRGLSACHVVAADIEAFQELPSDVKGTLMRIVSPEFLEELRGKQS